MFWFQIPCAIMVEGTLKKEMGNHLDFCIAGVMWVSTVNALHWDIPSKSYGLPGHVSKVLPNP